MQQVGLLVLHVEQIQVNFILLVLGDFRLHLFLELLASNKVVGLVLALTMLVRFLPGKLTI